MTRQNITPKEEEEKTELKSVQSKIKQEVINSYIAEVKTSGETQLLTEQNVSVFVLEATYRPGGIFQFAFNEYTIVTNPFGWMTKRRENDFIKLREYF